MERRRSGGRRTKREMAFQAILSGKNFDELNKEFSRSTVYAALEDYFPYVERRLKETGSNIRRLEAQEASLTEQVSTLEDTLKTREAHLNQVEEKIRASEDRLQGLNSEIEEAENHFNLVQKGLEAFTSKGVTEEMVRIIGDAEFDSGGELMKRVETFQEFKSLREEKNRLEKSLQLLEESERGSKERVSSLRQEIISESSSIDELKRRHMVHEEAIELVYGFLRDGFDRDILTGVRETLKNLVVQGQPQTSVKRLLDGLTMYRELAQLETEITSKREELSKIERELEKTKRVLTGARDTLVSSVKEGAQDSLKEVTQVADEVVKSIRRMEGAMNTHMETNREAYMKHLEDFAAVTRHELGNLSKDWREKAGELIMAMGSVNMLISEETKKLMQLKEEAGKLENITTLATVMLGILTDIQTLRNLPIDNLVNLVERINLWTRLNHPNTVTKPSENVRRMESGFSSLSEYRLSALTQWISEEFKNIKWGRINL